MLSSRKGAANARRPAKKNGVYVICPERCCCSPPSKKKWGLRSRTERTARGTRFISSFRRTTISPSQIFGFWPQAKSRYARAIAAAPNTPPLSATPRQRSSPLPRLLCPGDACEVTSVTDLEPALHTIFVRGPVTKLDRACAPHKHAAAAGSPRGGSGAADCAGRRAGVRPPGQGLTLVHFSAQLEPCLSQAKHPTHSRHPLHTGYTIPTRTPYPIKKRTS